MLCVGRNQNSIKRCAYLMTHIGTYGSCGFKSVHVRHEDIQQNAVRLLVCKDVKCLLSAIGADDIELLFSEHSLNQ